jgi:leucyl aminopeptidase
MLPISIQTEDLRTAICDVLVLYVFKGRWEQDASMRALDEAFGGRLYTLLRQDRFDGARGARALVPAFGAIKARKICVIGLGDVAACTSDTLRMAGGQLAKVAKEGKLKRVAGTFPFADISNIEREIAAQALFEGMMLGAYEFRDHFGTHMRKTQRFTLSSIVYLASDASQHRVMEKGLKKARIYASACGPRYRREEDRKARNGSDLQGV